MIGRVPPRFVPTLTTVVELPQELPVAEEMIPDLLPASMLANPPDIVAEARPHVQAVGVSEEEAFRLEDQLLHRVLQRIDLSLEERLTDSVSAAVQRQLDAMLPQLRSEIESVLRSLVIEALAQELSENTGSTPAFQAPSLG